MEGKNSNQEPNQNKVFYPMNDVEKAAGKNMKEWFKKHYLLYTILFTSLALLFIWFSILFRNPGLLILILAVPVYASYYFWSKGKDDFMRQMAKEIGYKYSSFESLYNFPGEFSKIGHSQEIKNVLSGSFEGVPIRIFTYHFAISHGKSRRNYSFTVFEAQFNSNLPGIILLKNPSPFLAIDDISIISSFSNKELLKLEGDFDKYFHLYCPREFEIETLQIFTPDIMAEFIDNLRTMSMEIIGNKIYFFKAGLITRKADFLSTYQVVAYFLKKMTGILCDVGEHIKSPNKFLQ